ncbi:MAG: peroxidase family protein, partial [Hyphomicrobium sp.]|nr:peroxidase family protein [Hyphomicrobium sp.]
MASFNRTDLDFILNQILQAEAGQPPVNPHLTYGLREVMGTNNSAVPGQSDYGAADQPFLRVGDATFQTVTVNIDGTIFDPNPGTAGDTMTTSYQQTSGIVVDTAPRVISNLISDQSANNPAALQAAIDFAAQLGDGYTAQPTLPALDTANGTYADGTDLFIGNITPDAGLSAPFNTWMTLFGQFFDHGLDLVTKGGSGTVFVPLLPDDPLYVPGSPTNFMVLTRATNLPGPDGLLGTPDDVHEGTNTVTPFVDQNQTYTSHPSHQVFLRDYVLGADGRIHSSGALLDGHRLDGSVGGMATWADVKANALKLGITLTDADVGDVPLLATDAFGNFIAGPNGFVQVVVKHADGTTSLVEGTAGGLDLTQPDPADPAAVLVRTGHAFLNDIAHTAAPNPGLTADLDDVAGPVSDGAGGFLAQPAGTYDDELLDAHYMAGDGRANENIGLTAVHEVFHSEHNRLVEHVKTIVLGELAKGDTSFATNWVLPGTNLADGIQANEWNGERLFQAAKFGTETQYQHLVFEEFARKIAPAIHLFGNVDIHLDPAITAEFAHAVYRFGHSMLDESLPRFLPNADGTNSNVAVDGAQMGLIEAFLNPLAYLEQGADAASQLILGTTSQIGNEIDEFVTGALRNNLLGLPLDLATLNIARGRDTGVPTLNILRNELFAQTGDTSLKAYASWDEFGQFLKHPASLINFVAAYGVHQSILAATTLADKRAAALAIVQSGLDPANHNSADPALSDAYDFMHSLGAYANNAQSPFAIQGTWTTGSITGVDAIDLWIGGLAEKQTLNGGLLGTTFNFIFETQLENLQDGDRLYYLPRIEGLHWGTEIEANSFAEMIIRNTGVKHISASVFLTPEYVVEAGSITDDPATWLKNPVTGAYLVEKLADGTVHFIGDDNFFGNTIVLGGTEGDDRLLSGQADDDTVWGDGGNDWIDGGNGDDLLFGGEGNDTISDSAGLDVIHADAGNDIVDAGLGDDIAFGGDGNDFMHGGAGIDAINGGEGNDIIFGDEDDDELVGDEGDDWIDGGIGGDILVGDHGAPTGQVPLISGNDVLDGGAGGDRMQGFSGDDVMLGKGGFDRFEGRLGFDWASFEGEDFGVSVDMNLKEFIPNPLAPAGDAVRDRFIETEAVSGSAFDDFLQGTNNAVVDVFNELTNVNLIFGLDTYFAPGPVAFSNGNIMFGGDGNDFIQGNGGNDIIDGDAYLHVELTRDAQGQIGPNSQIVREILYDGTPGDIDTAVFTDIAANYTISLATDADGNILFEADGVTPVIIVAHDLLATGVLGIDGIDTLHNIERFQFADVTVENLFQPSLNFTAQGVVDILGDTNPGNPGVDVNTGSPLSSDVSTIFDPDGIATPFFYQWQVQDPAKATWINIAGATEATFTPVAFYEGKPLRLQVQFVDGLGHTETLVSAATNPVTTPAAVNTAPFIVQQQALVGIPDTQARQGGSFSYSIPVTTIFGDGQTAPNQLIYSATLANGQPLDGSAAALGLRFAVLTDAAGNVTSVSVFTAPGTTLPAAFVGAIDIRVTATDRGPGTPLSVTDAFVVNVLRVNQAPTTNPDAYSGSEDTPLVVTATNGVLQNDTDPENNPLTAVIITGAANGTVQLLSNGSFVYTPDANFAGEDSFTYAARDGRLNGQPATVTLTVAAADDGLGTASIAGTGAPLRAGETLTASVSGDPDGDGTISAYQWVRTTTNLTTGALTSVLVGTNSPDYLVTAADGSSATTNVTLSVDVTYTDGQGFAGTATSPPTAPVGAV